MNSTIFAKLVILYHEIISNQFSVLACKWMRGNMVHLLYINDMSQTWLTNSFCSAFNSRSLENNERCCTVHMILKRSFIFSERCMYSRKYWKPASRYKSFIWICVMPMTYKWTFWIVGPQWQWPFLLYHSTIVTLCRKLFQLICSPMFALALHVHNVMCVWKRRKQKTRNNNWKCYKSCWTYWCQRVCTDIP
jgi:hypothetical protein